jgi:protein-S-isoprenylcysteine O-methyltransferase Ste14
MAKGPIAHDRTRRFFAILGSAIFFILAPGTVAGLIPWWITHWDIRLPFFGFAPFRAVGILLIGGGIAVVLESFARFALEGIGTPAPVFPTHTLVVNGFYRYVRNPMYVALTALILGQALLLGNTHLLLYAIVPWLAAHLFVLFYEEPKLHRTFGAQYEIYYSHVPRWIPRLTPWRNAGPSRQPGRPAQTAFSLAAFRDFQCASVDLPSAILEAACASSECLSASSGSPSLYLPAASRCLLAASR